MRRTEDMMERWSGFLMIPLLLSVLSGCNRTPPPPQMAPPLIEPGHFDALYRSLKTVEASTSVGVTMVRFGELLQGAATEVSIAKDHAKSEPEKTMVADFASVLSIYVDSATFWRRKTEGNADAPWKPNIFIGLVGRETELDPLVAKYKLPVSEGSVGTLAYRTVPENSAQRIWSDASTQLAAAVATYEDLQTAKPIQPPPRQ